MISYFKRLKDILTYYDYEPLIFFVALYDFIDLSAVLLGLDEWNCNLFQTFDVWRFYDWMPLLYWLGSILILITLTNKKWFVPLTGPLITFHAIQSLVYLVDAFILDRGGIYETWGWWAYQWMFDLTSQLFWGIAWIWILFQMKKKELYQNLGL